MINHAGYNDLETRWNIDDKLWEDLAHKNIRHYQSQTQKYWNIKHKDKILIGI